MQASEAIETIKCAIAEVEWNYPLDYSTALEEAIEALKYRIERRLLVPMGRLEYGSRECPNCHNILNKDEICNFCKYCGQKLNWGEILMADFPQKVSVVTRNEKGNFVMEVKR